MAVGGEEHDDVIVPETDCPLTQEDLHHLHNTIHPLEQCNDYGAQLYIETRTFVYACINDS